MTWTDEKVSEMLRLKAEGKSHSEIARIIGCGSRLEVSGKLWRVQKRKRQPGSNMGRKCAWQEPAPPKRPCVSWEQKLFLPYPLWKAERKKERELGLR